MSIDSEHWQSTERASFDELRQLYRVAGSRRSAPRVPVPPDLHEYGLEVGEVLGVGGMGAVFRARQRHPEREVAVKVLSRVGGCDDECRLRFDREIQALSSLNSPYVVPVYGTGTTPDGLPFYVMELIDGEPFETYAERRHLPLAERLRLFVKICEGVQTAHRLGIIHRDLKPSNILIDVQGRPRILDLGLAKFLHHSTRDWGTISGICQVMGTPGFMAPEQFQSDSELVGTRADCYSLGVMLYRLLVKQHPYAMPDSVLAAMHVVCTANPVPPREHVPDLPRDLEAILLKALEKHPDRRYQSAEALGADVERFLGRRPVEARLPTLRYRVSKFVSRNRLSVFVSTGAVAAVLLMVGISTVNIVAARRRADRALDAERAARRELNRRAYLNSLAAIDQRLLDRNFTAAAEMLRQAPFDERSWEWRRLAYRATPWVRSFTHSQAVTCLGPAPNHMFVTGDADGVIAVRDVVTGKSVRSWRGHGGSVLKVDVSASGTVVLSASAHEAKLWDFATGIELQRFRFRVEGPLTAALAPRFGPHAFIVIPREDAIQLVDHQGTIRGRVPLRGSAAAFACSEPAGVLAWATRYGGDQTGGHVNACRIRQDGSVETIFHVGYRAHALAVSDDGRRLGVAGSNETRIKELDTGNFNVVRQGRAGDVLAFLPGTSRLLVGSVRGLDVVTYRDDGTSDAHVLLRAAPLAAAFGGRPEEVLVLEEQGVHILSTDIDTAPLLRGPAPAAVWTLSPDGARLAVQDEALRVYSTESGHCVRDFGRVPRRPTVLSFSADGSRLASAHDGHGYVTLHDLETGGCEVLPACSGRIAALAFGPGSQIAALTADASLYFYHAEGGSWRQASHDSEIRTSFPVMRFDATGKRLAVAGEEGGVMLFDVRGAVCLRYVPAVDCREAVFSPCGQWLLIAGLDSAVLWDRGRHRAYGALRPFPLVQGKRALLFSADGRRILAGERQAVSIWDVHSCGKLGDEPIPLDAAVDAAFNCHGDLEVAGTDGALFRLPVASSTAMLPAERGDGGRFDGGRVATSIDPAVDSVVGLLGLAVEAIPGTPAAHAVELGFWRAQGLTPMEIESLSERSLADIDVLRIDGAAGADLSSATVNRLCEWVSQGGRLFLSGTHRHIVDMLSTLGAAEPGATQTRHIPHDLPGFLPVNSPLGRHRLLHASRYRTATDGGTDVCVHRCIGRGRVAAVLADDWSRDAPAPADESRCYLGRGDNARLLRDCIEYMVAGLTPAWPPEDGDER